MDNKKSIRDQLKEGRNTNEKTTTEQQLLLEKLRASDASLRAIVDYSPDAIVSIDDCGLIVAFNPAAEELFGYSAEEIKSKNVSMLMPSPYREKHDSYMTRYREKGESDILNRHRELPGKKKDGSLFPLELTVTHVGDLNLFHGIMRDLSRRKLLEKEVADISERERENIGREIHDGLGQRLTALTLMATNLKRELENKNISPPETVLTMQEQLREAVGEAANLAHGLAPVPEMPHGLSDALKNFSANVESTTGKTCRFLSDSPPEFNDRSISAQLYRIAQEAVNNAVKHAHSTKISIELAQYKSGLELRVSDDGIGFDLSKQKADDMHGLRIMHHRADVIGYLLNIQSNAGGTIVSCHSMY